MEVFAGISTATCLSAEESLQSGVGPRRGRVYLPTTVLSWLVVNALSSEIKGAPQCHKGPLSEMKRCVHLIKNYNPHPLRVVKGFCTVMLQSHTHTNQLLNQCHLD